MNSMSRSMVHLTAVKEEEFLLKIKQEEVLLLRLYCIHLMVLPIYTISSYSDYNIIVNMHALLTSENLVN